MKLKVITLNTWLCHHYSAILNFIRAQDPDVLLLQELPSGRDHPISHGIADGFERLRQDLPHYQTHFTPMRRYTDDATKLWMGHAIFSKLPIKSATSEYYFESLETVELKPGDRVGTGHTNFPGLLIGCQLDLGGSTIICYTTHFLWSLHPEINDRQRQAVVNLLNLLQEKDQFILGGDFNITDESEIYARLREHLIDDRPSGTTSTIHPEIHKVGKEKQLGVDFLFHRGSRINLIGSRVPIVPLSDHLPIIAEYEIKS